jgi:hypothetical protein
MSDFKRLQQELVRVKNNRKESQQALFLSKEKFRKISGEKNSLLRRHNPDAEVIIELQQKEGRLEGELNTAEKSLEDALSVESKILSDFDIYTDSRKHINQASDDYPILLFPVRVETRFKKIAVSGNRLQHQLWVRIFPDDCSVDTFEGILSDSEVKKARNYWSIVWSAGRSDKDSLKPFILNQRKAAWKVLSGGVQAGRAFWVTENYVPINIANIPARENESDVILTIATEEIPDLDTQAALKSYWSDIWKANGKLEDHNNALIKFKNLVNNDIEDHATKLIEKYIPFNFDIV